MIFIVDGTGPASETDYATEMGNSFCQQLAKEAGKNRATYWRGPALLGLEVGDISKKVVEGIESRPRTENIYLCGYSRGGLAVIVAAGIIRRVVTAMFLFDAVDRALGPDGGEISGNVRRVYFARRNPDFARQFEPEVQSARGKLDAANKAMTSSRNRLVSAFLGADPRAEAAARTAINTHAVARNKDTDLRWNTRNVTGVSPANFSNTGLTVKAPGRHEMKSFDGSHGALGGVPWSEQQVPGDAKVVPLVRAWMWPRFMKEGVFTDNYTPSDSSVDRTQRTA